MLLFNPYMKNLIKISFFVVIILCSTTVFSQTDNANTILTLNSENDSVNYAFGMANGNQFKQQVFKEEKDTANLENFHKAFLRGFNADFREMPDGELQQITGTHFGISLLKEIKDGFFIDSTWIANKDLIYNVALEVVNGKDTVGGFTKETAREFFVRIYSNKYDTILHEITPEKLDSLNVAFAVSMANSYMKYFDSITGPYFAKGFKFGFLTTDTANIYEKIYEVNGSYIALRGFEMLSKNGLMNDSTITLNVKKFLAGVNADFFEDETVMTQEFAVEYLRDIAKTREKIKNEKLYGKNIEEGKIFLAENAKRKGIIVTESGLQYEIIKKGRGKKPTATDRVKVRYIGYFIDGRIFDSSFESKTTEMFGLNQVIKGWTEVLQLMPVGSKWKIYIPYQLGYDVSGADKHVEPFTKLIYSIEPFATLVYEVELLKIEKTKK